MKLDRMDKTAIFWISFGLIFKKFRWIAKLFIGIIVIGWIAGFIGAIGCLIYLLFS